MATKKTEAEGADDLLGGTPPADDLLAADAKPSKSKKAAKPAAKVAAKVAKAPAKAKAAEPAPKAAKAPAKAAKPAAKAKAEPAAKPAKPKAAASGGARGVRGQGKFYFPQTGDEFQALQKQVNSVKKAISTREMSEKFGAPTWKVRLVANAIVKSGKGKLEKAGSVLVYDPS